MDFCETLQHGRPRKKSMLELGELGIGTKVRLGSVLGIGLDLEFRLELRSMTIE